MKLLALFLVAALAVPVITQAAEDHSVARVWNEVLLDSIRADRPVPPVHTRNLFHLSAAMWDAWAAYETGPRGVFHDEKVPGGGSAADREIAVSYAAYRILSHRFGTAATPALTADPASFQAVYDQQMVDLGLDPAITTTIGWEPAAVGNRVAAEILELHREDGSNEMNGYADTSGYEPVNPPMLLPLTFDVDRVVDKNLWQPLSFVPSGDPAQVFVTPHWGDVIPFALTRQSPEQVYLDPGLPPQLGGYRDAQFKLNNVEVIRYSSWLDPDDGVIVDISPAVVGNNTLGTNDGSGHGPFNPVTGEPYGQILVKHADFGRASAEFWADGPDSETPPGHWNTIANEKVTDRLAPEDKRLGGTGPVLDALAWDVHLYLVLNAAVFDAGIAAWDAKEHYDYVRPITSIRYMAAMGQSTDATRESFHPDGLPLVPGLIEEITAESSAEGARHAHLADHVGEIAIRAWLGAPEDPSTYTGVDWILGIDWIPYQLKTFVTPAFAGYVSGHSTFSRAAAEALTLFTGSPYFPEGLGTHTIEEGSFGFEYGPSEDVTLYWATYYDAADEAGESRLYGGIHVFADDGPGRIMGAQAGIAAYEKAMRYFAGEDPGFLVGEWIVIPWLGYVQMLADGWMYHDTLRFLYAAGDSANAWLYTPDFGQPDGGAGWVWTSAEVFPHLYRASDGAWLWYAEGSRDPRMFYNLSSGVWEEF